MRELGDGEIGRWGVRKSGYQGIRRPGDLDMGRQGNFNSSISPLDYFINEDGRMFWDG